MIFILVFVVIIVMAALSFFRLRSGGPGPQVNWVPRSMRGRMNGVYRKRGWQQPYDKDGERNPDRDSL